MCGCYSIAVLNLRKLQKEHTNSECVVEYEQLVSGSEEEVTYYLTRFARRAGWPSVTERRLRDEPLTSEDLAVCNGVLEDISREFGIAADSETVARLASIIIELFRQGVRDAATLRMLAAATRETEWLATAKDCVTWQASCEMRLAKSSILLVTVSAEWMDWAWEHPFAEAIGNLIMDGGAATSNSATGLFLPKAIGRFAARRSR
jgi:hypothetical protein